MNENVPYPVIDRIRNVLSSIVEERPGLSQEKAASKLQVMGIDTSREIISQMESGSYSIRVSILLALEDIHQVDLFDDRFRGL